MALDVLDERGQQGMGAVQLPGENTVRMGGGDRAHGIREQAAQCIDFREIFPLFDDIRARMESAAAIACDARARRSARIDRAMVPFFPVALALRLDMPALTSAKSGSPLAR